MGGGKPALASAAQMGSVTAMSDLRHTPRDHGGDLDDAAARFGGARTAWLDLSTGINPVAYTVPAIPAAAWTTLPDTTARAALEQAARRFWRVPARAGVLAAPGTSSLIARIPVLRPAATVTIPSPTYNEHRAAFRAAGWRLGDNGTAHVAVHPNNPDGRLWRRDEFPTAALTVIDESFCDTAPQESLIAMADRPGVIVLKSVGKFWGLAGMRLGFAIGDPQLIARLGELLGPWPVPGPAIHVGSVLLNDAAWAERTRERLAADIAALDTLMSRRGVELVGGTTLFRTYAVDDAAAWQERLAQRQIWTRVFPYSKHWLRLGLPAPESWPRLQGALAG